MELSWPSFWLGVYLGGLFVMVLVIWVFWDEILVEKLPGEKAWLVVGTLFWPVSIGFGIIWVIVEYFRMRFKKIKPFLSSLKLSLKIFSFKKN